MIQLTIVESDGDLRHFFGVRKCVGTQHVKELREFYIDGSGFHVGRKPTGMSGIHSGQTQGALTEVADEVIPSIEEIGRLVSQLDASLMNSSEREKVREVRVEIAKIEVLLREHFGLTEFHKLAGELLGELGKSKE